MVAPFNDMWDTFLDGRNRHPSLELFGTCGFWDLNLTWTFECCVLSFCFISWREIMSCVGVAPSMESTEKKTTKSSFFKPWAYSWGFSWSTSPIKHHKRTDTNKQKSQPRQASFPVMDLLASLPTRSSPRAYNLTLPKFCTNAPTCGGDGTWRGSCHERVLACCMKRETEAVAVHITHWKKKKNT